jgi:GNAT superfamily N-acetyltransferase
MIQIRRTSKAEIEPYRMEYLSSLPAFQDIYIEFIVNESEPYLLLTNDEIMGYAIVSPDHILVECYIADKYLQVQYNPFPHIIAQFGIKEIYCKTFDYLLLNFCVAQNMPYKTIGYLYRDYIDSENPGTIDLSSRYAEKSDISFLISQDDEVFEPKDLLESQISNKSIVIFENGPDIAGCGFLTRVHRAFDYYDIGVWVHPAYRRKGYATGIVQHLKHICLDNNWKPIIGCDAQNTASQSMLDKQGFISKHKLLEFDVNTAH